MKLINELFNVKFSLIFKKKIIMHYKFNEIRRNLNTKMSLMLHKIKFKR